jgi:hypothetical protein
MWKTRGQRITDSDGDASFGLMPKMELFESNKTGRAARSAAWRGFAAPPRHHSFLLSSQPSEGATGRTWRIGGIGVIGGSGAIA